MGPLSALGKRKVPGIPERHLDPVHVEAADDLPHHLEDEVAHLVEGEVERESLVIPEALAGVFQLPLGVRLDEIGALGKVSSGVGVVYAKPCVERHAAAVAVFEKQLQRLDAGIEQGQEPAVLLARVVLEQVRTPVGGASLVVDVLLEDVDAAVGENVHPAAKEVFIHRIGKKVGGNAGRIADKQDAPGSARSDRTGGWFSFHFRGSLIWGLM